MRYADLFVRGGMMMWPIAVCLLIALVVVVDRFVAFRRVDADAPKFLAQLRTVFRKGDRNAVLALCGEQRTMLSVLVRETLGRQGEVGSTECMDRVSQEQTYLLERRLPLLTMSATIAPMLGFLGTLLGLVAAMRAAEIHPSISGSGILAGHIWVSLVPSVFGLAVGVPALAFQLYFESRIRQVANLLVSVRPRILELLEEPASSEPVRPPVAESRPPVRATRFEDDEFFRRKTDVKSR